MHYLFFEDLFYLGPPRGLVGALRASRPRGSVGALRAPRPRGPVGARKAAAPGRAEGWTDGGGEGGTRIEVFTRTLVLGGGPTAVVVKGRPSQLRQLLLPDYSW